MSDEPSILQIKQARLRVLEGQAATFGNLCPPHIVTEIDQLRREIAKLDGSAARAGLPRPPQSDFAHPYPIQSGFTGRVAERTMLTGWLSSSAQPVLAVIGIGGMGKSALTWAWLQRDVLGLPLPGASPDSAADSAACRLPDDVRPEGVLWWSFYETQASFASFLDEAISYGSKHSINPRDLPSTYDKARALLGLLQQRRLLLVLDGFERELRAYSSLGAAYQGDAVDKQPRGEHRACADPHAGRFLRDAATLPLQSRILITSRLFPRELDDLAGCKRRDLATIDPEDAVTFFQSQGIRGTRAEIQAACAHYGYHALALRLLAGLINHDPTRPGDMRVAAENPVPDLVQREHHVLELAYEALRPQLCDLLGMLAAFRSPVDFETTKAIFDVAPQQPSGFASAIRRLFQRPEPRLDLKAGLKELVDRGLLFFDREQARYDMHPVVRGYAYDRLGDKPVIHIRLVGYFAAVPALEENQVQSLDDLIPMIELYHHTIRAGRYDEAYQLYRDRLDTLIYFRFGNYALSIDLVSSLFPNDDGKLPCLSTEAAQASALNDLAAAYSLSGQNRRAVHLYERQISIREEQGVKSGVATGLSNLSGSQIILGELVMAERNLRRSIELAREIGKEGGEAIGHQRLGWLLAYQGMFEEAEQEIGMSIAYCEKEKHQQGYCQNLITLARGYLLMGGDARATLEAGRKARELADVEHVERDIIRAEWLVGAALVAQAASSEESGKSLIEAESHLSDALTRCRRINMIDYEPDILLAWARWQQLQGNVAQARADADEALAIADRREYRLAQADIHNFLAQLALQAGDRAAARRHAAIAKERAWCDGPPHCYKPALDEAERLLGELERGA
jgi:tetratricopeptide (TPR) repeat protein